MGDERIACRELWVGYRTKTSRGLPRLGQRSWALRDLNLSVAPGELVGVVGSNGCGKTTLLRTVAGVYAPSRGEMRTRGKVGALVELRPDADRDLSVGERIALTGVLLGFRRRDMGRLGGLVVEFGDLDRAIFNSPLYTLSTGMLLRLEMALLLHSSCEVLAIDELLNAADADFRARCLDRLREICHAGGGVLMSSHDPSLVSDCDRIIRLEAGRQVETGAVEIAAPHPPGPEHDGAQTAPAPSVDRVSEAVTADPE